MLNKEKKTALALGALSMVGVIGSSYAYWNQTTTIHNPFDTGAYGTSVVEEFSPEDGENWQPGATIDKEVYVTNEGDVDVIARVRLDEAWTYTGERTPYKSIAFDSNLYLKDEAFDIYVDAYQNDSEDGATETDGTVVKKIFSTSTKWIAGGDGWYYYNENLKPGKDTDIWLTDVTLDKDVDLGVYNTRTFLKVNDDENWIAYTYDAGQGVPMYYADGVCYYSTKEAEEANIDTKTTFVTKNKSVIEADESKKGYSDSDYVLSITVETVQATEEAVEAMYGIELDNETYDDLWKYYTDEAK